MTGLDPWTCSPKQVKIVMSERLGQLPEQDKWRLTYLGRLLEERGEKFFSMEDTIQLTELIDSLCVN